VSSSRFQDFPMTDESTPGAAGPGCELSGQERQDGFRIPELATDKSMETDRTQVYVSKKTVELIRDHWLGEQTGPIRDVLEKAVRLFLTLQANVTPEGKWVASETGQALHRLADRAAGYVADPRSRQVRESYLVRASAGIGVALLGAPPSAP